MQTSTRSFRIMTRTGGEKSVEALLNAQGFCFQPEPFAPQARVLTQEPFPLGASLASRLGLIYIQDRSSMLPPVLLAPPKGAVVLDMCAAPGSKTGFLAQLVGHSGLVFGVEPGGTRMGILRNNLRRLSLPQTATALCKGEKLPFADESFDYILLDPPCSGWGTENKHPGISDLWTGEKTKPLIRLQRKLLKRANDLLKPGGRLLYSTCTTNVEEDEEQVAWASEELGLKPVALEPPAGFTFEAPLSSAHGTLKVANISEGQGFYMAAFTKPGEKTTAPQPVELQLPGTRLDLTTQGSPQGLKWSVLPHGEVWNFGGRVYFLPQPALELAVPQLRWQGLALGRMHGGQFRPDGLCKALVPTQAGTNVVDIDDPEALSGLLDGRGIKDGGEDGFVGLLFQGQPLGWLRRKSGRLLWTEKDVGALSNKLK